MKWYKFLKDHDDHKKGAVVELSEEDAAPYLKLKIVEETEADPVVKATAEVVKEFTDTIRKATRESVLEVITALGDTKTEPGMRIQIVKAAEDKDPTYGYGPKQGRIGRFAMDVRKSCAEGTPMPERLQKYMNRREEELKAITGMSESVGEDGGVLVLDEMSTEIYRKAFPEGSLLARTQQRTIAGNNITYNSLVENSRVAGSRHGGVRGYWMGEGDQYTKSKPKYTRIKFELNKLGVLIYVTDELMEDVTGIALEAELMDLASDEIDFMVSDSLVNGVGDDSPQGLLNANCKIAVARDTSTRVKEVDIRTMWARMHVNSRPNSVWFINQEVEPQLDIMFMAIQNVAESENVGGFPVYFPPGGIADSPYGRLKGRPVIPIEFSAALGTEGDIILVDMGGIRSVRKSGGIKASSSIHLRFDFDEMVFKFTFRIDAQSMWASAVTPFKGTSTLSHIITLAA